MPATVRLALFLGLAALLVSGGVAWTVRGPAILLDLSAGAARFLCL